MSYSNSDQPKDGAEPSMEEILASIRRILKDEAIKSPSYESDDDILVLDSSMIAKPVDLSTATSPPPAPLPATESPATPLQSTAAPLHFASEPTLISPAYTSPPAEPEPEVLLSAPANIPSDPPGDLPIPVKSPPSIFSRPEPLPEPASEPFPEPQPLRPAGLAPPPITAVFGGRSLSDFPVLGEQRAATEPPAATPMPVPPAPEVSSARPFFAAPPPPPDFAPPQPAVPAAPAAPEPVTFAAPAPPPAPQPAPLPSPPAPEPIKATAKQQSSETKMPDNQDNFQPPASLVSDQVTAAAANSIGAMLRSLTAEKSVAISRQGVTIEDMVRDEIRPLLKSWLDTNLAGLVERVVRAEIEKVLERSTS